MIDLSKENFEEEVLKAQGYVLVDFYGDGCVPCAALMPHIHKFEEVYGTTVKFCSLNTTKARRLAIAQKVLGLPVIAIIIGDRDGVPGPAIEECAKTAGAKIAYSSTECFV